MSFVELGKKKGRRSYSGSSPRGSRSGVMSVLDKKAEAALEAIAALRKHTEAVEDTVKKLLLEVRGSAGTTTQVVQRERSVKIKLKIKKTDFEN